MSIAGQNIQPIHAIASDRLSRFSKLADEPRELRYHEVLQDEPYRCSHCRQRITDGGAVVPFVVENGVEIEIDATCCSENCAEAIGMTCDLK